ncbi:hypothetical protein BCR35DRAFT_301496 [Leucosporidium creatinivorum]|uniref:Uncharacterized protein n=1 Tax=Leucosporidium creatinivorum TaxID=106004 RepID=A0A1Y2FWG0_9BASI|nr:hypothetical protein BCR35DRAFT_301496 [Leucosporidium creatinivorum]
MSSSSDTRPRQLVISTPTARLRRLSKCGPPVVFELVQPAPSPSSSPSRQKKSSTSPSSSSSSKKYRNRPLPPLPPPQSPSLSLAERRASSSSTASTESALSEAMDDCLNTLKLLRTDAIPPAPSEGRGGRLGAERERDCRRREREEGSERRR